MPIFLIATLLLADGRVLLRDRVAEPLPNVVRVAPAGVGVQVDGGERVIPWQNVLRVEGPMADKAAEYMPQADDLWRALQRLDRGDLPAAEAILERLNGTFATTPGPTAEAISWGLMRCRLERGAQAAAAAAWLAWIGVKPAAASPDPRLFGGSPVLAELTPDASDLVPAIPPIWLNIPSVAVTASGGTEQWRIDPAQNATKAGNLRAWYVRAARGACGLPLGDVPAEGSEFGSALVEAIVDAQYSADDRGRLKAREVLRATMVQRKDPWIESWARVAIGRSMLRESDPEIRRLGVVELLQVPARLESAVPYLTGVALAEAAAALRGMNDLEGATRLRDELVHKFPGHPALEWSAVRDWPKAAAPAAGTDNAAEDTPP